MPLREKSILLLILSFMLMGVNLTAQVDSVRFKTGDYMLGEVKHMKKGILQIETDYSDSDFQIEWKKTSEIYSISQFLINLSNGETYFGRLYPSLIPTSRSSLMKMIPCL